MNPPPGLHGEVDTPRPLRAALGRVSVAGWCLAAGEAEPPAVRLVTPAGTLPAAGGRPRPDVAARFPGEPAAARCGFAIAGALPPGVHPARFEARGADGGWRAFREHPLAVEAPPLFAVIEQPPSPVAASVRVAGWACHPLEPLAALELHYGDRRVPCELGLPRADVPGYFPGAPHAGRTGFISVKNLPVGRGRLRLRARLSGGRVCFARTDHEIAIETDEENRQPVRLAGPRAALGPVTAGEAAAPPAGPAVRPLRILYVLYGDFFSNSAIQVASLANELAARGHAPAVVVPRHAETLHVHAGPRFAAADYAGAAALFGGAAPDVIHAWTTREPVRAFAEQCRARTGARLVVHLEDNELEILAQAVDRPKAGLLALADAELDPLVPPDLSHPRRGRALLAGADGVTVILDRLREFVPADRPCHTIWPAADGRGFFPRPRPAELRAVLDARAGTTVLCYHGNVHPANRAEVRELYAAVLALNRAGQPVALVRTGVDTCDFLGDLAEAVAPYVLALGQIPHHHHLGPLLALADIFVQPGVPDAFNDYRFPSKLPEFFALGRPVVLPRTNLGALVRHGTDAYVLDRADAAGIAAAVGALRRDPALYARLSRGAAEFAAAHFSWPRSAAALEAFYASLPAGRAAPAI